MRACLRALWCVRGLSAIPAVPDRRGHLRRLVGVAVTVGYWHGYCSIL